MVVLERAPMWCLNALAPKLAFRVVSLPPGKAGCLWRQGLAVRKWPFQLLPRACVPEGFNDQRVDLILDQLLFARRAAHC